MNHVFKHPDHYKKMKEENKDFLEEIEKEQKILDIGLKQSRQHKKERTTIEELQKEWPDYTKEELEQEQRLADMAEQHKIKD